MYSNDDFPRFTKTDATVKNTVHFLSRDHKQLRFRISLEVSHVQTVKTVDS